MSDECRDILNSFFIIQKGYDPQGKFLPSNETRFVYEVMRDKVVKLEEREKKLIECVSYYAYQKNNCDDDKEYQPTGFIELWIGKRARQTLKELGIKDKE